MPIGFRYRRAQAADLGTIVDLRIEFERITRDSGSLDEAARRAELRGLLGPDLESGALRAWLAEDAGAAVAQAALRLFSSGEGEILNVYTTPGYRRRGIGGRLVDAAIAEARALGLRRLTLQSTDDSRRLYKGRGFRAVHAVGADMTLSLVRLP
jgi:N-acetylglutamate synthase-like GNAT family acetyltransferase